MNNIKNPFNTFKVSSFPFSEDCNDDLDNKKINSTEEEKIEYPFDIIEFIVNKIDDKHSLVSIHEKISSFQPNEDLNRRSVFTFSSDVVERSNKIKSYFKNRLLMRRLKNQHMSKYMECLEELLETPRAIKMSHIKIAVKLPDFYREGTETEEIFKKSVSLDKKASHIDINEVFKFVGTVKRHSAKTNTIRYYFKNEKGNLLLINCLNESKEHRLLDFIARTSPSILIRGNSRISHQQGYEDFLLYHEGDLKFYDPNS